MFTEIVIEQPSLWALSLIGWLAYWNLLGRRWDQRIFLALNLSLMSIWVAIGNSDIILRLEVSAYIFIMLLGYWSSRSHAHSTTSSVDRLLDFDAAPLLLVISAAQIYSNISSGYTTLDDKAALLIELSESSTDRYTAYILLLTGWLSVHTICRAANQPCWSWIQLTSIAATAAASMTGLSKGSFMPLLLALLFVYRKRISIATLGIILAGGIAATIFMVQRLFPELENAEVARAIFERVIKNVDVLDYIDALGLQASTYPHQSPFYLAWPWFQIGQKDFAVPGVWLHGTLFNDWRGFGPNPTFIGDQIIASNHVGLILAIFFGRMLREINKSHYRVLLSLVIYNLLQDWYLGCLQLAIFIMCAALLRAARKIATAASAQS